MPYRASRADPQALERERPWVFAGGTLLAAMAGFINACLLGVFHVPVSHMTGAVSRLSLDLETIDLTDLRLVLSILGGFLVGAMLSGLLIGGRKLVPGRRYGMALLTEGAVLGLATYLLVNGSALGVPLAALACGIQNAMASSYNGLILRTTHVTGIVTDVGVMLGHWLRHRRIRLWKLLLLLSLLGGFLVGGVGGAQGPQAGFFPFYLTALMIIGSMGVLYTAYRKPERRPFFEAHQEVVDLLKVGIPIFVAVYLIGWLGIYATAGLYLAFFMAWYGKFRWWQALAGGILLPLLMWLFLTKGFGIPMPMSMFYRTGQLPI
jgi:uncharacterized membrane protein YoaK (UPF0700 family)